MVTITQKDLVQRSFADVLPIADDVAALFYMRLFALAPSVRAMFPRDLTDQRRKLVQMLTAAVKGLDRPEQLIPVVQDLGRRHASYGVVDAHYAIVAQALISTLEIALGRSFTPAVQEAWTAVYALLATTMMEAAHAKAEVVAAGVE